MNQTMENKETINKIKLSLYNIINYCRNNMACVLGGTVYNLPDIPKTSQEEVRR